MAEDDPQDRILAAFTEWSSAGPMWVCEVCTTLVPVSGAAIVAMIDANRRETVCASDDVSDQLETLQFSLGEGPCVEASSTGRPVLVSDVREVHHARWPMFAAAASRTPARAVYAFPLQLGAIRAGVFDLYRDRPGLLQRDELAAALLCADVALWALLGLRGGGETDPAEPQRWPTDLGQQRAETHQATGMVMAQMEVSAESALATLRAYAYSRGRPLDDVAREVIARRLRFSDTAGTEVGP